MHDRRICGYRVWKLTTESELRSITLATVWPVGKPLKAECRCGWWKVGVTHPQHESPATTEQGSGCGIHAVYRPDTPVMMTGEANVRGVVVCHGVKEFHEIGFRAQYAEPICLYEHLTHRRPEWTKRMKEVSSKYGIPIVDRAYLNSFASEHGTLIDPKSEFA